jgi:hypothetical protein
MTYARPLRPPASAQRAREFTWHQRLARRLSNSTGDRRQAIARVHLASAPCAARVELDKVAGQSR